MQVEIEEKFEDWRGKEAISGKHGGIKAAFIACGNFLKLKKKNHLTITNIIIYS